MSITTNECIVADEVSALALKIAKDDQIYYRNCAVILGIFAIIMFIVILHQLRSIPKSDILEIFNFDTKEDDRYNDQKNHEKTE